MRPSHLARGLAVAALGVGCMKEPLYAPVGSTVAVNPSTLDIAASPVFLQEDNVGAYFMVDAQVLDPDGVPLENTQVEVQGPSAGIFVMPQSAVKFVDFPEAPEDVAAAQKEDCYTEDGVRDASENEWCAWYYDEERGEFYQFSDEYADAGGYQPNYALLPTDGMGIARFFMFVDQMPYTVNDDGTLGEQGDQSVFFTIRVHSVSLTINSAEG